MQMVRRTELHCTSRSRLCKPLYVFMCLYRNNLGPGVVSRIIRVCLCSNIACLWCRHGYDEYISCCMQGCLHVDFVSTSSSHSALPTIYEAPWVLLSSCDGPHQNLAETTYASLEATDAWRIARFLASDSERRSRCSFSRVVSILWYSCCSVFFCRKPPDTAGCQAKGLKI